jgi:glutaconate CoA-transferase subunit A
MDSYTSQVNGDPIDGMKAYLDDYIYGPENWTAYLSKLGVDAILDAARRGRRIGND